MMGAPKLVSYGKDWYKGNSHALQQERLKARLKLDSIKSLDDLPDLISRKKVAEKFSRNLKTVERWQKKGSIYFVKIQGEWFTTPELIALFLKEEISKHG